MYRQCSAGVAGVATAIARDGQDTEAFTRVLRMDTATERSIGMTIRVLQKLQDERGKRSGLVLKQPLSPKAPIAPSPPKSASLPDGDSPQISLSYPGCGALLDNDGGIVNGGTIE
jgi:hypothetical protein